MAHVNSVVGPGKFVTAHLSATDKTTKNHAGEKAKPGSPVQQAPKVADAKIKNTSTKNTNADSDTFVKEGSGTTKKVLIGAAILAVSAIVLGFLIKSRKPISKAGGHADETVKPISLNIDNALEAAKKAYIDKLPGASLFRADGATITSANLTKEGCTKMEALVNTADGVQRQLVAFDKSGNATHNIIFSYNKSNKLTGFEAFSGDHKLLGTMSKTEKPIADDAGEIIGKTVTTEAKRASGGDILRIGRYNSENKLLKIIVGDTNDNKFAHHDLVFAYDEGKIAFMRKEIPFILKATGQDDVFIIYPKKDSAPKFGLIPHRSFKHTEEYIGFDRLLHDKLLEKTLKELEFLNDYL